MWYDWLMIQDGADVNHSAAGTHCCTERHLNILGARSYALQSVESVKRALERAMHAR